MTMHRLCLAAAVLLLAGCKLPSSSATAARRSSPYRAGGIVKPVVAVSDFENLASPPAQWNLGRGMADHEHEPARAQAPTTRETSAVLAGRTTHSAAPEYWRRQSVR